MKKIVVLLVFLISNIGLGVAQKVAIVDIGAVLEAVPEYKKAQEDLDKISTQWRQEINQELDKIKSMYNKYQAEQVIMSDEMRKQKEDEITKKEKDVRELQKEKLTMWCLINHLLLVSYSPMPLLKKRRISSENLALPLSKPRTQSSIFNKKSIIKFK